MFNTVVAVTARMASILKLAKVFSRSFSHQLAMDLHTKRLLQLMLLHMVLPMAFPLGESL